MLSTSNRLDLLRRFACRIWSRTTVVQCSFSSSEGGNEISFEELKPTTSFVSSLTDEQKKVYERTLEEFEIFVYMGKYVPKNVDDEAWGRALELPSVKERVEFWEYLAVKQRRENFKDRRRTGGLEKYKEMLAGEQAKFDRGEMGYGPDLYQLLHNPLRNRKKVQHIEGTRVYSAMMTGVPKVALDVQYVAHMSRRNQSELGNQMQYSISENFNSRTPFPMSFVNMPSDEFAKEWLSKSVGFYAGMYVNQTLLPDFTKKGIKETFPEDKDIIYISRYARDVLDGPLKADVISLCVTMDFKRESLAAARRSNVRVVRLPLHRYVKWKSGPQYLPFPNLLNVLREVYASGGDWRTALHNNISRRHLYSAEEDDRKETMKLRKRARDEEKRELIEAIQGATGGH